MKKGFTLIELLAVIVILAIIALIATPIILNIIEDSKEQSVKSSANLYVDGLVKQIATKNLTNEFNPSSCTITNGNVTCDGTSLTYEVNGDKPTSGSITFNNGIVTGYTLCMSDYRITKSGNNVTSEKESNCIVVNNPAYTLGQLLQYDPVNNEGCSTGATCYKWRVITPNDTTSNSTITLQMDHNLVNTVAWVTQADYGDDENWDSGNVNKGPITALKALETATSSWDNSLKLNYTYDTSTAEYNYGTLSCTNGACIVAGNTITTNLKARMITGEEMRAITVAAGAGEGTLAYNWTLANGYYDYYFFSSESCPIGTYGSSCTGGVGDTSLAWLIENTYTDQWTESGATLNTYDEDNGGYWALTPRGNFPDNIWFVEYSGQFTYYNTVVDDNNAYGVRPVITIPKSVLN